MSRFALCTWNGWKLKGRSNLKVIRRYSANCHFQAIEKNLSAYDGLKPLFLQF
jgi:hypothetical protein